MLTFEYTNLPPQTEDEYSALWTWYVASLEAGEFEAIVGDTVRRRQLDRFVAQHSAHAGASVLVLVVPTLEITKSPAMLTGLLSKYYAGVGGRVTITPMGSIQESQMSVILVKNNAVCGPYLTDVVQGLEAGENNDDMVSMESSLSRTSTVESPQEPLMRVETQLSSSQHSFDEATADGTYLLHPVPTDVSTLSQTNQRLILRSMLLKDVSSGEIHTAIRQIEDVYMGDDWLVYDDSFAMTNLQLLTLDDVFESNPTSCKFLFYTLTDCTLDRDYDTDEEIGEHDLTVVEFDGGLDSLSPPIKFVRSNTTEGTTPMVLSGANTLHTQASIRSEMMMHRPDAMYTPVARSRSLGTIKKVKRRRSKSLATREKCIIM